MWLSLIVPTRTAGLRRPDYALSERVGAEKSQFDSWVFNWLII
jgi:hypothetical protein